MKKLYEFYWDCGRSGHVEGLFIEDSQLVKESIGKDVYFGEILGKHSEVYGTLDEEDLKVISEDEEKIEWLESTMGGKTISGSNPFNYIDDGVWED